MYGGFNQCFYGTRSVYGTGIGLHLSTYAFDGITAADLTGMFQQSSFGPCPYAYPLKISSIASSVKSTKEMYWNCDLTFIIYDYIDQFTPLALPLLEDCRGMFGNCKTVTGTAEPIILGVLSGVPEHKGCFFNCTSLSDYNILLANYPDWVLNHQYDPVNQRHLYGVSPNYPAAPVYRLKTGNGYLRGTTWSQTNNKDFWTYLENIPSTLEWDATLFIKMFPNGWGDVAQNQVQVLAAMQDAFGLTVVKDVFTSYAAMVAAYPDAADNVNGEILFS
jgi:hypothetical protein